MSVEKQSWGGGRYEAIEELGAGGMGRVFVVRVTATGGRAALKELSPTLSKSAIQLERFRREATAMGGIEHPHLTRCFDFAIEEDGTAFLVMELLDGRSLSQIVKEDGPLEGPRAARLGAQVASALAAAHENGVIHRDVKPANVVVVTGYDGREIAKLVDFGVASIKESSEYQRLTSTGQIVGTPNYMAPEQLTGDPIDERTDVYSLGALLYGVLAARHPYSGHTLAEVVTPLLAGDRPPLPVLRPELGALAAIVERAMELDPDARFQSAAELGAALTRMGAVSESAVRAAPPAVEADEPSQPTATTATVAASPALLPRPGLSLRRIAIPLAAASCIAIGAVVVMTSGSSPPQAPPQPPAVTPTPIDAPPPPDERVPEANGPADAAAVDAPVSETSERLTVTAAEVSARIREATACNRNLPRTNLIPYTQNHSSVSYYAAIALSLCLPDTNPPSNVWVDVTLRGDGCARSVRPGGSIDAITRRCFRERMQSRMGASNCESPVREDHYRVHYEVQDCGTGHYH